MGAQCNAANIAKGMIAGAVAGLVASWTMNHFQSLWTRMTTGQNKSHGAQSQQQGQPDHGIGEELRKRGSSDGDENAAVRAGTAVANLIFERRLDKKEREFAGTVAHYAMGVASGAAYGAAAEVMPSATAGEGTLFGTAVWLVADEAVVPALGLSKSPAEYPLSTHAYALASHLVYGASTELVRRSLRRAMQ